MHKPSTSMRMIDVIARGGVRGSDGDGQSAPLQILTAEQLAELDPTETQLEAFIASVETERAVLRDGDATASAARRIRELTAYRNVLVGLITDIRTPADADAPVPDSPASIDETPAIEEPPVVDAAAGTDHVDPADDGAGVLEEAAITANLDTPGGGVVPPTGDDDPQTPEAMLAGFRATDRNHGAVLAEMRNRADEAMRTAMAGENRHQPIRAHLGGDQGWAPQLDANWATRAMGIVNRHLAGPDGSKHTIQGIPLWEINPMMASVDIRSGQPLATFGKDAAANQRLLDDPDYMIQVEALMADLCGLPTRDETRIDPCGVRTDEPILAAMRTPVPIGNGKVAFFPEIFDITSVGGTLPQIWYESNQNAVDPDDRSTWKGCATLPDCNLDQVTATMYMLPSCLQVCTEDEISRPEVIEQANLLLDVIRARIAESYRLDIIDAYTGVNGAVYNSDWSSTGYGAAVEFQNQITRIMIGLEEFERRTAVENLDVIVPAHLPWLIWLDFVNSGRGDVTPETAVEAMRRVVSAAGFRSLVITPDYGSAEGATFAQLTNAATGDPYAQPPTSLALGGGVAVPALPTAATIRIVDLQEFRPGLQTIHPYELRRSPELLRQNCAQFFGETGHMLYKKGCSPTFRLDIVNICPNGARINEGVSPFAC